MTSCQADDAPFFQRQKPTRLYLLPPVHLHRLGKHHLDSWSPNGGLLFFTQSVAVNRTLCGCPIDWNGIILTIRVELYLWGPSISRGLAIWTGKQEGKIFPQSLKNFNQIFLILFIQYCTFVRTVLYVSTTLRSALLLFVKLNKVLMESVIKFYDKINAGRIINRIQDDTYIIDDDLSLTFRCFLENVSRVTGLSIGLVILEPIFVFILIGVVFLYYQVSKTYIKSNREIKRLKSVNQGQLPQTVNETLTGIF